jgi:hypothetical protein
MLDDVRARCNSIEECYEYMLAYAAQGLPGDTGNQSSGQLRHFLNRAKESLAGLAASYGAAAKESGLEGYQKFLTVLDRDASDSIAAVELVLAQPAISSQLIDNLNASIHLRALLTDLFLIDEILKPQHIAAGPAAAN